MPGLTAPMGVCASYSFHLRHDAGSCHYAMLVSLYCGATFGGSIAAILVHAPGTPAAAATTFDGYPLAQKGQAGKALGHGLHHPHPSVACSASLVLILLAPVLAEYCHQVRAARVFCAGSVFGLSMISSLGSKSVVKNLLGGTIGVFISCVGMDAISRIQPL